MKLRIAAIALAGAVALAGCGGGSSSDSTGSTGTADSAAPAATSAAPASSAAAEGGGLALADTSLGKVVVDGKGMTLYMFTVDTNQPSKSNCEDDCLAAWPPLLADEGSAPTAADGIDASKLGTVERSDGTQQVTLGGWPLYYFAKDTEAGDVNGQDVGEKWYVVDGSGTPIKD